MHLIYMYVHMYSSVQTPKINIEIILRKPSQALNALLIAYMTRVRVYLCVPTNTYIYYKSKCMYV